MSMIGRIIGGAPTVAYAGSEFAADADSADTVISVLDVGDFDDDALINGGVLILGAEVDTDGNLDLSGAALVPYTTCDDDTSTVTLQGALGADWSEGDAIYVLDPATGLPVAQAEVYVEVEGADHTGDGLPAIVTYGLLGKIGGTDDEANGQVVTLEEDEDEQLVVVDVHGADRAANGLKFWENETTVTGPGSTQIRLKFIPEPHSEELYWNGVHQRRATWSRDRYIVDVEDVNEFLKSGDKLVMEYAYRDPTEETDVPPSGHWVEESFHFRGVTGTPLFGATVVGAASIEDALSDADAGSYVDMPADGECYLTTVPRDLTEFEWTKLRLELDLIVVGGGSGQTNWELYVHGPGEFDGSSAFWNAPAIFEDGTLSQKIPVGPEYPEPNMGDNGNVDGVFSITNTVAQAAINDPDGNHMFLTIDTPEFLSPDYVVTSPTIRVTGARLVVSRWVVDS